MARTNYQMVRKRKEAERKTRRDNKSARRLLKNSEETPAADSQPLDSPTTLPAQTAPE